MEILCFLVTFVTATSPVVFIMWNFVLNHFFTITPNIDNMFDNILRTFEAEIYVYVLATKRKRVY